MAALELYSMVMLIQIPLLNDVNLQLKEGAPFAALRGASTAALLAGFGCVWVFTLLTQVEAVPKYGMIQVVI
jgi:hypothetical protein